MTTRTGTAMTQSQIDAGISRIEAALGEYVTTAANPCGGAAYYDAGEPRPWRLLYCDGARADSFRTVRHAVQAAERYVDEMDATAAAEEAADLERGDDLIPIFFVEIKCH